tara:strand:- start:9181 stop:9798 length:618 start_codon:yes stop_codon:yes gene_type:complete
VQILIRNRGPLGVFVIFFTITLIINLSFSKLDLQVFINSLYHPTLNVIFLFFTRLVEGWFVIPLFIILLFVSWRKTLFMAIVWAVSSGIVQFLKHFVFTGFEYNRPAGNKFLTSLEQYYWWTDDLPHYGSFPSGHTTAAFCIFLGLSLIASNKKIGTIFMVIACFVGLSRPYLSYHFLIDVTTGSFLGTGITLVGYLLLHKKLQI